MYSFLENSFWYKGNDPNMTQYIVIAITKLYLVCSIYNPIYDCIYMIQYNPDKTM